MNYIFFIILSLNLFSQEISSEKLCSANYENLPTQAQGRVKPLYVLATEAFKTITGKSVVNSNAVVDFCQLSFISLGLKSPFEIFIKVEHQKSKEFLNLKENENLTGSKAIEIQDQIRSELMTLKLNDSYKKDLNKVYMRIELYKEIISGTLWTIPQFENNQLVFKPFVESVKKENVEMYGTGAKAFDQFFINAKTGYDNTNGTKYQVELFYKKLHPFSWSILIILLAIMAATLIKNLAFLNIFTSLAIIVQLSGMIARIYISGRAPITNMYETVMFSGLGALIISFIIYLVKKEKPFVLAGLAYNILCLMMMNFAGDMLDSSISPLVPVLRDNFWLSTHVTTIILSYAALALSWILANMLLIKNFKSPLPGQEFAYYLDLIYLCLKFGVVLLGAGIILGGVWADYSWGRFWGWDPKETWSLIVLLIYMAILHGKYTNWITNQRFAYFVAGAFLSVMMAWFGVNYILASGLHSYGFSEGGAIFLASFFAIQISILLLTFIRTNKKAAV